MPRVEPPALFAIALAVAVGWTGLYSGLSSSRAQTSNPARDNFEPQILKPPPYQPALPTEASKRGERLFESVGCMQCHSVQEKGGCLAPSLDGVGARRSPEYMELRLTRGKDLQFERLIGHPDLLPHPRFAPKTVKDIIAFLETLPPPKEYVVPKHPLTPFKEPAAAKPEWTPNLPSVSSSEGKRLFYESGCMQCHSVAGVGGFLAPKLDGIGARHSRAYIEAHVSNPQAHEKRMTKGKQESAMPQFDFSADEVRRIADFLLTLPNE